MPTYFETRTRDNGETFTCCKTDAPEWVSDACQEAHARDLPNDWIYEECRAAFEAYEAGEITEGETHEHTDNRVDVYTRDAYQWAADFCLSYTWAEAEEAAKDLGMPEDTEKRIQVIQYAAIQRIAEIIVAACDAAAAAEENDDS